MAVRAYEAMCVLKPGLEEEQLAGAIEKIERFIQNNGGSIRGIDKWGKRRLAYEVAGFREGFYVVIKYDGDSSTARELERMLKLSDEVIRYLIVRQEAASSKKAV